MPLTITKTNSISYKTSAALRGQLPTFTKDRLDPGLGSSLGEGFEPIAFENTPSYGKNPKASNGAAYLDGSGSLDLEQLDDPDLDASGNLDNLQPEIKDAIKKEKLKRTERGFFGSDFFPWANTDKIGNPILRRLGIAAKGTANKFLEVGAGLLAVTGLSRGAAGLWRLVSPGIGYLTSNLFVKIGIITSLPALFGTAVRTYQYVYNFNWNQTDQELDSKLKSQMESLYGLTGGLLGSSVGYLVCGALPGATAFAFNPTMARAIMQDLGDEAKDELMGQLAQCSQTAFQTLVNAVITKSFQGTRKWLKRPGTPIYNILVAALGDDNFTKWGDSNRPSFSFAEAVETRVENIKDPRLRNFTEEFLENFSDSCLEASYTVVNTIESQMAAQKLMQQQLLGQQRTVAISFNPA